MVKNIFDLSQQHFVEKDFERFELFQLLREKYGVRAAIYPGSFVHITPSLVYPVTAYVEMDKRAKKFFDNPDLHDFVWERKTYPEEPVIKFFGQDYQKNIPGEEQQYDLLISQYAGFVSKPCKRYLKIGGILIANNSHGDAGMASIDADFKFIGVVLKRGAKHRISEKNLAEYFVPKKAVEITPEYLEEMQKGIGYIKTASSYLFRKVR
jgi:hypothetical protein